MTKREIRQILKGMIEWGELKFTDEIDNEYFIKLLKGRDWSVEEILDLMESSEISKGLHIVQDMRDELDNLENW